MTTVPADPLIGQTLDGRYAIRSRIARGGMAMVYLANDLRLERRVAVKVMHQHLAEDESFTRRFEREARSAARLSHPNLVNVFDQGQDAGRTYLVMEYLPSITLRHLLRQQKRLTAEQAMEISEAVLSGLAAAHQAGIVHRDLKPENVLLADDGRIKLGDFGLARAVSANTTTGQALLGTIAYLSPELVTRGVADARSDLYAFGIMLFEMLTGEQPFVGEQPMQIAYQHANSEVPPPSTLSDQATPALDELVLWTTQRDPELRPRDAAGALAYLHSLRDSEPGGATRVVSPNLNHEQLTSAATTVLHPGSTENASFAPVEARSQSTEPEATAAGVTQEAAVATHRRKQRGRWLALLVLALILLAGAAGWWFGQGPGSRVTIPDVAGESPTSAQASLEKLTLRVSTTECSSLDIEEGLAVATTPAAGARVDRESAVELCISTGPEQLPVPTIAGLSLEDAEQVIGSAGFTMGDVVEQRFSTESDAGIVLAALDANGDSLGEQYPEQGRIDLIVSAGPLPDVSGLSVQDATQRIEDAGLTVDASLNTENYDNEVSEGSVRQLVTSTDPVRVGDPVGLDLSLGPELFEVPNVEDMSLQEAMDALEDAGFSPTTWVPDALRELATATGTDPAAGERVPAGTEIRVKGTVTL